MKPLPLFVIVAAVLLLVSCGGGGASTLQTKATAQAPPVHVTISVSPASGTVAVGATMQFTAAVQGGGAVNWQVAGINGGTNASGTISAAGLYSAPAIVPSNGVVSVRAVLASDSTQSGSASVTVSGPPNPMRSPQSFPIKLGTSGGNVNMYIITGQTSSCCSGTLGSLLSRGGQQYVLSNNHVLARLGKAAVGETISQPGIADNGCMPAAGVAAFSQAAPLQGSNVDAAIAVIQDSAVDPTGAILGLGSSLMEPAPPASTIHAPGIGVPVAKTGRTTGLTCSSIEAIDVSLQVDYSAPCIATGTSASFSGQIAISGSSFSAAGDSGSLVVDSATAEPVGLLFAGSDSSTIANPISDVLAALKDPGSGEVPVIVGGAQHPVGCPAATPANLAQTVVSPQELARAASAKARFETQLLSDPAVISVTAGASHDDPGQGAVIVYVDRTAQHRAIPAALDGVRTRVIHGSRSMSVENAMQGQSAQPLASADVANAAAVKHRHESALLSDPVVFGVAIGASNDDAAAPAVIIYADRATRPGRLPVEIEGLRTRIIRTAPFRAFGWGEQARDTRVCRPAKAARP